MSFGRGKISVKKLVVANQRYPFLFDSLGWEILGKQRQTHGEIGSLPKKNHTMPLRKTLRAARHKYVSKAQDETA